MKLTPEDTKHTKKSQTHSKEIETRTRSYYAQNNSHVNVGTRLAVSVTARCWCLYAVTPQPMMQATGAESVPSRFCTVV
ncbi:MAG TPA: hypothetical protein VNL69_13000 [Bacteroidota bacterium]|nr:hypothetical protein [Bacteroidota bacterium]